MYHLATVHALQTEERQMTHLNQNST